MNERGQMERWHDLSLNTTGEVRDRAHDALDAMAEHLDVIVTSITSNAIVDGLPSVDDEFWLDHEEPAAMARYIEISDELHLSWRHARPVLWFAARTLAARYWAAYENGLEEGAGSKEST